MFCLTLSSLDTQFTWVWCCLVNMPGILVSRITNTINWMNYWHKKFIPHCSGGWKSETRVQQHSHVLVSTFLWAADSWLLIVSSEESPANTPYLPKTLTPHTISWGVGFQNMNFTQAFSAWQWVYSESSQVQVREIPNSLEQGWHSFKQKGGFEEFVNLNFILQFYISSSRFVSDLYFKSI